MQLNYKKIFYIGLIFFIISMFWQAYDMLIARLVIDKFGLSQTWSGIVMALDNILAVFLLPIFGTLSDKSEAKLGRRTPFIIIGTLIASLAFMALSFADHLQTEKLKTTNIRESYDIAFTNDIKEYRVEHWQIVVANMHEERLESYNNGLISYEEYLEYKANTENKMLDILNKVTTPLSKRENYEIKEIYYNYLSSKAWNLTIKEPRILIIFMITLFVSIVGMSIFRSPAVALMPDVTIKPERSRANAIITFMGAIGGVFSVYIIMLSGLNKHTYDSHSKVFIIIGIIMIISLLIFLWKVKEPKWRDERVELEENLEIVEVKEATITSLSKRKKLSLYFLLISIFFLFMGYNAVMSKIADYLPKVLNLNFFDIPFILAQLGVIIMIIPIGILSIKIGRKPTIILGLALLLLSFIRIYFLKENSSYITAFTIFIAGIGLSMVSINTYVMVVELASGDNAGLYTGYYYSATMGAQILTPILSGIFMDKYGRLVLFPYASLFLLLALITFLFVKEGEAVKIKKGIFKKILAKRGTKWK